MNRSAMRTLDILELFRNNETLSLAAITKMLDIPKSSAFDIVKTLESRNYLEVENDELKTYRLGHQMFSLGNCYRNNLNIYKICSPALVKLKNMLDKTVFLGVLSDKNVLTLEMQKPYGRKVYDEGVVGELQFVHTTSMGKAMLSAFSDEEILKLLGPGPYARRTEHTLTTYEELIEDIRLTRKRGYAEDNSENYDHIACVGMAILDHKGRPVAAVSVSDYNDPIDAEVRAQNVQVLKEVVSDLSLRFGYMGN